MFEEALKKLKRKKKTNTIINRLSPRRFWKNFVEKSQAAKFLFFYVEKTELVR